MGKATKLQSPWLYLILRSQLIFLISLLSHFHSFDQPASSLGSLHGAIMHTFIPENECQITCLHNPVTKPHRFCCNCPFSSQQAWKHQEAPHWVPYSYLLHYFAKTYVLFVNRMTYLCLQCNYLLQLLLRVWGVKINQAAAEAVDLVEPLLCPLVEVSKPLTL